MTATFSGKLNVFKSRSVTSKLCLQYLNGMVKLSNSRIGCD